MNDVNLLLRILGDPDDAKAALREVSRRVAAFGKQKAKATVDVATERAQAKVRTLRAELLAMAAGDYTAVVEVKERFDRSLRARLAQIGEAARDTRVHLGLFSLSLYNLIRVAAVLGPLLGAVGAALVGLAGSAGSAALALGALGVAGLGVFGPMAALVGGIVARFKEGSAAATELKQAAQQLGQTFTRTLAAGADLAMAGMAQGLRSIATILPHLQEGFTALGGAVGRAAARIGEAFAQPAWVAFFQRMTQAATRIVPLLTDTFISLSAVLRDIATAALPYLESGLAKIAEWARSLARSTADAARLDEIVAEIMGHLGAWLGLIGAVGDAVFQVFRAANPAIQSFLESITASVNKWAEWAASTEGQEAIRKTFEELVPLAEKLLGWIVEIIDAAIDWAVFWTPLLNTISDLLSPIFDFLSWIRDILKDLPGPIRTVLGAFLLWNGITKILTGIRLLLGGAGILGALKGMAAGGVIGKTFGTLTTAASTAASTIGSKFLPMLARIGPKLLRFAGPYGLAAAAVLEYGDDLGRGIASLVGFGDDAIREANRVARRQGRLADDIRTVWGALPRRLQREMDRRGGWEAIFTERELRKLADRTRKGGKIATSALVDGAFERARKYGAPTLGNMAQYLADSIKEAPFFKQGERLGEAVAKGIKQARSKIVDALNVAGQALKDVFSGGGGVGESVSRSLSGGSNLLRAPINRALGDAAAGATASPIGPAVAPAAATASPLPAIGTVTNNFVTPAGGPADPEVAAAQFMRRIRERGLAL